MNENDLIYDFAKQHEILASGLVSLMMPQTLGAGIGVKSLDGCYQMVNQGMQTFFNKNFEQIIGLTDADLFPPEVAAQLECSDLLIKSGAMTASDKFDFVIDGETVQCLWFKFPVHGPDGQVLFIGAAVLDTVRLENIERMQKSLEHLQRTNHELQKNLVELSRLASTDKLTGAWNRRRLEEALANEMDRLKRYNHPFSVLILDIDFFKKVNDEHGHAVGDQVLVTLANVVKSTLRTTDSLTRLGGEEFVVLCPNATLTTVTTLAERLRQLVARAEFPGVKHVTVSIGVAQCRVAETWEDLFKRADKALYLAKAYGRNQVQIASEPLQMEI